MSGELLPTEIFVDNQEKEVIYGNALLEHYTVGGIMNAVRYDEETKRNIITKVYKITKVELVKTEVNTDGIEVHCDRIQ